MHKKNRRLKCCSLTYKAEQAHQQDYRTMWINTYERVRFQFHSNHILVILFLTKKIEVSLYIPSQTRENHRQSLRYSSCEQDKLHDKEIRCYMISLQQGVSQFLLMCSSSLRFTRLLLYFLFLYKYIRYRLSRINARLHDSETVGP